MLGQAGHRRVYGWYLAALILSVGVSSAAPGDDLLLLADRQKLAEVALDLKGAILREDAEGVLRHVSRASGLRCTDTQIPYRQIKRDLHNKTSHLYMSVFDSNNWSKRCGSEYPVEYPAISDKEFFATAEQVAMEIEPIEKDWVKVTFKSNKKSQYPREFSFHRERGIWRLTDGFVVSRCSCG